MFLQVTSTRTNPIHGENTAKAWGARAEFVAVAIFTQPRTDVVFKNASDGQVHSTEEKNLEGGRGFLEPSSRCNREPHMKNTA